MLPAPQKVPKIANLGCMVPKNTALFVVGDHGPPPQAQLLPIETLQASMEKGCETELLQTRNGCWYPHCNGIFPDISDQKNCMFRKPPTSPSSLCHPILCSKEKLKSYRKLCQSFCIILVSELSLALS